MSKQKGKMTNDEKSYILRIREMEISVEDKQRSVSQDTYHSIDGIKDVIKSDIAGSRLSYLANYEMAENGLSSDVFTDENNCLVHSMGDNMYPECTNIYYEVVDEKDNVVDIDWSDTLEYFDKNSPAGNFYVVSEYSTENDGPLGVTLSKCRGWFMPDERALMGYDISRKSDVDCITTRHESLDECLDYIKSEYNKIGEGWYEGMMLNHLQLDDSLSDDDISSVDLCVNEIRQKDSLSEQRGQQAETELGSVDITEEAEDSYLK